MTRRHRAFPASAIALALALAAPLAATAQDVDICGCEGNPDSLGDFNTRDEATWRPLVDAGILGEPFGNSAGLTQYTFVTPPDGVLVFDSFRVDNDPPSSRNAEIAFTRNDANTPITLLVSGDVVVASSDLIRVDGGIASGGSSGAGGVGGNPGPGGFAGGDGAYPVANFAPDGGDGVGPGGGAGGDASTATEAEGGTFLGVPELRPLVGGSGGGGGYSISESVGCAGGGGGGGAGALLIAANGTITVTGTIRADGGSGGSSGNATCARGGGGGSGGAIRLVARTINGGGTVRARGGSGATGGGDGSLGAVAMEAITNTFSVSNTEPVARRFPAPGPLVNPLTPTGRIVAIDRAVTPENPVGHEGDIDMFVQAPGVVTFELETTDVPAGTEVEVTIKPKLRTAAIRTTVESLPLDPASCDTSGLCTAAVPVSLAAGAYIVEARATFQTPGG